MMVRKAQQVRQVHVTVACGEAGRSQGHCYRSGTRVNKTAVAEMEGEAVNVLLYVTTGCG